MEIPHFVQDWRARLQSSDHFSAADVYIVGIRMSGVGPSYHPNSRFTDYPMNSGRFRVTHFGFRDGVLSSALSLSRIKGEKLEEYLRLLPFASEGQPGYRVSLLMNSEGRSVLTGIRAKEPSVILRDKLTNLQVRRVVQYLLNRFPS